MLIKSSHKVALPKTYYRILDLYPACNNTFVFLGLLGIKKDCITHVNKDGHILFEHIFPKPIYALHMLNNKQCIFLETVRKWHLAPQGSQQYGPCITVLDLQTHAFTRTPHQFVSEQPKDSSIHYFQQTKLICVMEKGSDKKSKLKLTYYQYPLTEKSELVSVYESKSDQWAFDYKTKSVNQHSMVAWFMNNYKQEWFLRTYDLRADPKGQLNMYQFQKNIGISQQLVTAELLILHVWETTKGCFMLVSSAKKQTNFQNSSKKQKQVNLILDTITKTMRQAKFSFQPLINPVIHATYLGRVSMFRVFELGKANLESTPIYFIDNEKEKIVGEDSSQFKILQRYLPSGAEMGLMIHNQYECGNCSWFECESMKIVEPKQICLHFMLAMNENFDDNLVQDVIEMIDYCQ